MENNARKIERKETPLTPVMTAWSNAYMNRTADPAEYGKSLYNLAYALTYCVLKKCIDPQAKSGTQSSGNKNKALIKLRQELTADRAMLDRLDYCLNNAYEIIYTQEGERQKAVKDRDLADALDTLAAERISDGLDLVHAAALAIMQETAAQVKRDPALTIDLERPYEKRILNKRVYLYNSDVPTAWSTAETSPIKEIFRAIRLEITSIGTVAIDPRNGYSYIADLATDPESGEQDIIYKRLAKYSNLGGYAVDSNGAMTLYSVGASTAAAVDDLILSLNLTDKEKKIIEYRLSGYTPAEIAAKIGVKVEHITRSMERIYNRAYNISALIEPLHLTDLEKNILEIRIAGLSANKTVANIGNKRIARQLNTTENAVKGAMHRIQNKAKKIGFTVAILDK